jgi:DNA-binding NarL/FixJ family response regulator
MTMSTASGMIRLLTVDDHPLLRDGIAAMIANQPDMDLVAEAATGAEGIEKFRAFQPDVTLMDLRLPDMSGTDSILTIREEFPSARIIVLTTYNGDIQAGRALKAGAYGYLLKSTPLMMCSRTGKLKFSKKWLPEIPTKLWLRIFPSRKIR